jgi:hypothetical protein
MLEGPQERQEFCEKKLMPMAVENGFQARAHFEHVFAEKGNRKGNIMRQKFARLSLDSMPAPLNPIVQAPSAQKSASIQQSEIVPQRGIVQPPTAIEDTEILHASIKAGSVAQIVIAVVAVIGLLYLLKLVIVTIFTSILFAFVLELFVSRSARAGIPRVMGALAAVVLALVVGGAFTLFFL